MPFHWLRKPSKARFSGELHPSPNLMRTNEAFIQKVRELRSAIDFIKRYNEAPLGMMGSSLGGYTTALLASVDERLDYAVPVMPMGSLAELFWDQGEGDSFRQDVEQMGMTRERFVEAWSLHSPLSYEPKTPWKGRMLVTATGDGLVTDDHTGPLWHHWGRPRHHRFAGGHILQVYSSDYHRAVGRLLVELGYVAPKRLELALGQR
jgi:surfactin synthase thioesterase subunit